MEQQINMTQINPEPTNVMPPNPIPNQIPQFGPAPFNDPMFGQPGNLIPPNQAPPYDPPGFCNNNQPLFPPQNDPQQMQNYGNSNGLPVNNSNPTRYEFDPTYGQGANNNVPNSSTDDLPHVNLSQPPPGFFEGSLPPSFQNGMPDLSKPPPGFPTTPEVCPDDLLPSVPYFELPAGLMVPLIMVTKINNSLCISFHLGINLDYHLIFS